MKTQTHLTRWLTVGLVASTVLSFSSTAFADQGGRSRRFKGVHNGFPAQRVILHERSGSAGPALAGLIGGFILGSAVSSNARPVFVHEHRHYRQPVVVYRYYDPYGDDWYDSLDDCDVRHRGVRVIQVIDVRNGRHVRTLRYGGGEWHRMSGDYDSRDFDRRDSDGRNSNDDEGFDD
jgi:hypothetical protein